MDRRAFLLGALAAPIAAPAIAKAAAEPVARRIVGFDLASGPDMTSMVLAEVQDGMLRYDCVMRQIRSDHIAVVDAGRRHTGEIIWTVPKGAFPR